MLQVSFSWENRLTNSTFLQGQKSKVLIFEACLVSYNHKSNWRQVVPVVKHVYFYIFVGGWIFFYWCSRRDSKLKHVHFYIVVRGWIFSYWCSRRGSKLSFIFCRYFKFDFKRVPQYCFKGVFLIVSDFLTDLLEYAYVLLLIDSLL